MDSATRGGRKGTILTQPLRRALVTRLRGEAMALGTWHCSQRVAFDAQAPDGVRLLGPQGSRAHLGEQAASSVGDCGVGENQGRSQPVWVRMAWLSEDEGSEWREVQGERCAGSIPPPPDRLG